MTNRSDRLREITSSEAGFPVAPVFDPLSARIAEVAGWRACKLSGSVAKFASLALPDDVPLTNSSDLVDVCRRITRVTEAPLVVDADDGGMALNVWRTVRELEAAGASAIELEDNSVPPRFNMPGVSRHSIMISKDDQVSKLKAAVAARLDTSTMIVGRTSSLFILPLDDALDRIRAYSSTGIDALMLPGLGSKGVSPNPRRDIEAVRAEIDIPIFVSGLASELAGDESWLRANNVRLLFLDQLPYRMAVQAIYEAFTSLDTGSGAIPSRPEPTPELLNAIVRSDELARWEQTYPA